MRFANYLPNREVVYLKVTQSCLFVIPWTVACPAPLSMEFSRQEYWSRLPFPSPGDPPDPRIKPSTAGRFFSN